MKTNQRPMNAIEKEDMAAEALGRNPFWEKTYRLKRERPGQVYEIQLRAFKLMSNEEDQEIRLEKRGLLGGRPVQIQVIHLQEADLKGILMMFQEKEKDSEG